MYESILTTLQNYKKNIVLGTDQNFDYIKIDQHKNTEDLLNLFLTNGLVPTITKPTRIALIDNIYILPKNKTTIQSGILCVDISDHLPIIMCFGTTKNEYKRKQIVMKKRSINTATINDISSTLHNIDWQYLDNMTTKEAYTDFSHTLNDTIDHIAPERIIKIPSKRIIRDPWMTRDLIISSRTLNK